MFSICFPYFHQLTACQTIAETAATPLSRVGGSGESREHSHLLQPFAPPAAGQDAVLKDFWKWQSLPFGKLT